ncbi:MAG: aminoglycoside phosphotransferase family protein [Candidatus Aenigmarchaeota archaeon]|nr:aminoglycoside phosphotransferase family protein [Candidatus Aenigmarchaeota archaeon]MBI5398722.1 aminoglycoside phosphotransferase family protein [Candidatus Woesearchaeota archaeon]
MAFPIRRSVFAEYIKKHIPNARLLSISLLGSGWHGRGYRIEIEVKTKSLTKKQTLVLREEKPFWFSHDYAADRAKSFLLQHHSAQSLPNHAKSFDVLSKKNTTLVSIGSCREFYQLVEGLTGRAYVYDLDEIKKRGHLTEQDRQRALLLSDYLVYLHKHRYRGSQKLARSLHLRHTRDAIGDGEMLMGVLDTYPDKVSWINKKALSEIVVHALRRREEIKDKHHRLCRIHGDFHPANIFFEKDDSFKVTDASREVWGEPADDLTALGINYIWHALQHSKQFSGPFAQLFYLFWNNYFRKMRDEEMREMVGLFFAFRAVVVAHPVFYPRQADGVRRALISFALKVLDERSFDELKIKKYLHS